MGSYVPAATSTAIRIPLPPGVAVGGEVEEVLVGIHLLSPHPSSPGWLATPQDSLVQEGGYVSLHCRSSLTHHHTHWLLNGRSSLAASPLAGRALLTHHNSSLRLGPLSLGDAPVVIGCLIETREYGFIPSPLGTIIVESESHMASPDWS